ncbi:MAG: DMT family transporter, partial [Pseudomonadota bacterium]|nr:DMT family transporter [Pseudomonadota bacterium]
ALYYFMLVSGTAARATANFYLIPGTVAVLSWVLLGERLTALAVIGFLVASTGCWLVNARIKVSANRAPSGRTGGYRD